MCDEANWVFYRDRVNWNDVKPVPQDDGTNPIVAISYSEKCEFFLCASYNQSSAPNLQKLIKLYYTHKKIIKL